MERISLPQTSLNHIKVINHIDLPRQLLFPVCQGTQKDSQIVVSAGTKIKRGEIIAKNSSKGTQNIHSSVGGEVQKIRNFKMSYKPSELRAIEVKLGGDFSTFSQKKKKDSDSLSSHDLITQIQHAGIYDMDVGILSEYLQEKQTQPDISNIIINAIEFSPMLLLEEKILQTHIHEIAHAVQYISQLFSQDESPKNCIINSNNMFSKMKLSKQLKQLHFPVTALSTNSIKPDKSTPLHTKNNINLVSSILAKKIIKSDAKTFGEEQTTQLKERSLFFKPSSLLAIYEAIIFEKPFIDIYIQVITGRKDISILKVPLGIPIIYILSNINHEWKDLPSHSFLGNFLEREILLKIATPITKNIRHFWFLSDNDFTVLYSRFKKWSILATA